MAALPDQVGVAWAIAASRVVDNKHHPADVVAGIVLGATVGIIFLLRSIPMLRCLQGSLLPEFAVSFPRCMCPKTCLPHRLSRVA